MGKSSKRRTFKAGDAVECVNLRKYPSSAAPHELGLLQKGRIYRVAKAEPGGVMLAGIPSTYTFYASRFRKVEPASGDFTMMLRALSPRKREAAR